MHQSDFDSIYSSGILYIEVRDEEMDRGKVAAAADVQAAAMAAVAGYIVTAGIACK
jgi:hypothetical protein